MGRRRGGGPANGDDGVGAVNGVGEDEAATTMSASSAAQSRSRMVSGEWGECG